MYEAPTHTAQSHVTSCAHAILVCVRMPEKTEEGPGAIWPSGSDFGRAKSCRTARPDLALVWRIASRSSVWIAHSSGTAYGYLSHACSRLVAVHRVKLEDCHRFGGFADLSTISKCYGACLVASFVRHDSKTVEGSRAPRLD